MKATISATLCVLFAATGAASAGEGLLGRLFKGGDSSEPSKTIWQRAADTSGIHVQTNLRCPAAAGAFRLTALVASNPFGVDVWCQYETTTRDRITLYMTQRQGEPLQEHFDGAKTAIATTSPTATPIGGNNPENFTSDPAWLSALYDEARLRTGVWVTDLSGWTLKFRATYAREQQEAAFDAMAALATSAADSAGAHLTACATWKAPERTGKWIADERQTIPLVITATMMAYKPLRGPNAPPFVEPVWCMAQPLSIGGQPFVLWHNRDQQAGGFVDRITAMRDTEPLAILSISDTNGSKRGENPIGSVYDVVVETENQISVVGIYDGAPTLDEIAGFAGRRANGLFASIDKKTNKVTVYRAPPAPIPVRSSP